MEKPQRNQIQNPDLNFRPTAFCLIIDLIKNVIIVENESRLVGGGREQGETPQEACIREIEEETGIIVQKEKLHFFREIKFQTSKFYTDGQYWNGKKGSVFIYEYDSKLFAGVEATEEGIPHGKLSWCDLDEFFTINSDINRGEFEQFCRENNLPLKSK